MLIWEQPGHNAGTLHGYASEEVYTGRVPEGGIIVLYSCLRFLLEWASAHTQYGINRAGTHQCGEREYTGQYQ